MSQPQGRAVRRAIRSAGAKLLFLPPYSPDLNPIQQVFAKLKTLLRNAAERTVEATWRRIGALLSAFTPTECANYFAKAGYAAAIFVRQVQPSVEPRESPGLRSRQQKGLRQKIQHRGMQGHHRADIEIVPARLYR